MGITKKSFGVTKAGEQATLYTMENAAGMKVSVSDFGAVIVDIIVPDRNKNFVDVNLGYDNVSGYEGNAPGYGSFLGRVANRIAGAKFSVNGKTYEVGKTAFTAGRRATINICMRSKLPRWRGVCPWSFRV